MHQALESRDRGLADRRKRQFPGRFWTVLVIRAPGIVIGRRHVLRKAGPMNTPILGVGGLRGRAARVTTLFLILGFILTGPMAANASVRRADFGVNRCLYTSTLDDGPVFGTSPSVTTSTGDRDCRRLDANIKYSTVGGSAAPIFVKDCAVVSISQGGTVTCAVRQAAFLRYGNSRAQDWEKGQWGSSGWWGR